MTAQTFRKKPVEIQAIRWDGANCAEITAWMGQHHAPHDDEIDELLIPTLEGEMTARIGDWIIRGIKGEFYPCRSDIFEATYEPTDPKD